VTDHPLDIDPARRPRSALALALSAAWRDGEPEWAEAAPSAPPPGDCDRLERRDPMPGFLDRLGVRSRQLALIRG
jgi:hypothetical protein